VRTSYSLTVIYGDHRELVCVTDHLWIMHNPWREGLEMARVKKVAVVQLYSTIPYACLAVNIASIKLCQLEVSVKEDL
jgi:hypothetical protein